MNMWKRMLIANNVTAIAVSGKHRLSETIATENKNILNELELRFQNVCFTSCKKKVGMFILQIS